MRTTRRSSAAPSPRPSRARCATTTGEVVVAAIKIYGDTIHSLVERKNYRGVFLPGFERATPRYKAAPTGLQYVDHCVGQRRARAG